MNILTKICIVVLVILVLSACSAFLAYVVSAENYRQSLQEEKEAMAAADTKIRRLEDTVRATNDQKIAADDESNRLRAQNAQMISERLKQFAELSAGHSGMTGRIEELAGKTQGLTDAQLAFTAIRQEMWNELVKVQADRMQLTVEKLALKEDVRRKEEENADFRSKNQRLEDQVREREVTIAVLTTELERLREAPMGAAIGMPSEVMMPAGAPGEGRVIQLVVPSEAAGQAKIAGRILAIRNNIAGINVGSAHGVKKSMRMVITRGAQFIGYLDIETVEPGDSAGIVTDKKLEPQVGDQVSYPSPVKAGD